MVRGSNNERSYSQFKDWIADLMTWWLGENVIMDKFYGLYYFVKGCICAILKGSKWHPESNLYVLIYHQRSKPNKAEEAIRDSLKMQTWIEPHWWQHVRDQGISNEDSPEIQPFDFYRKLRKEKEAKRKRRKRSILDLM